MHGRTPHSVPGLYPLDAPGIPPPSCWHPKCPLAGGGLGGLLVTFADTFGCPSVGARVGVLLVSGGRDQGCGEILQGTRQAAVAKLSQS